MTSHWTKVSIDTRVLVGRCGQGRASLNPNGSPLDLLLGECDEEDDGSDSFCWLSARPIASYLRFFKSADEEYQALLPGAARLQFH